MAIAEEQLKKGLACLEKHGFDRIIYDFKIPDKWHELKSIECLDEFEMYKESTQKHQI